MVTNHLRQQHFLAVAAVVVVVAPVAASRLASVH
jgi:hypothetical protein